MKKLCSNRWSTDKINFFVSMKTEDIHGYVGKDIETKLDASN